MKRITECGAPAYPAEITTMAPIGFMLRAAGHAALAREADAAPGRGAR